MLASLLTVVLLSPAQAPAAEPSPAVKKGDAEAKGQETAKEAPEEKPVVTTHTLRGGGRSLGYSVTAGLMPLKNEAG